MGAGPVGGCRRGGAVQCAGQEFSAHGVKAQRLATVLGAEPCAHGITPPPGGASLAIGRRTEPRGTWPGEDILASVTEFEATWKLAGDMLVKVDRMSMAASIEVRCPLLDHKLAEFARRIPARWNMRQGKGKAFFLEALGDRLPPENLQLPKRGFGVPLAKWFREEAKDFLADRLFSRKFLARGVVRESFIRYLFAEHQSGRRDNYQLLYQLLMLGLWLEQWESEAGFRL
ncbi:asparagine synthase-related protein [Oscillatoria amoena NRMC-F 0135]|nr:asparagine synthase-related protein [Oscillatoria amoena NRMC-F 0135]